MDSLHCIFRSLSVRFPRYACDKDTINIARYNSRLIVLGVGGDDSLVVLHQLFDVGVEIDSTAELATYALGREDFGLVRTAAVDRGVVVMRVREGVESEDEVE